MEYYSKYMEKIITRLKNMDTEDRVLVVLVGLYIVNYIVNIVYNM